MLRSIHVKNLALIDEEEILLKDGLNILTGETGAGKIHYHRIGQRRALEPDP